MRSKFTKNSCGHQDRKHFGKGLCASCYQKAWYAANKEGHLSSCREWRKRNIEHVKSYKASHRKNHPSEYGSYRAKWALKNPDSAYLRRRKFDGVRDPERALAVVKQSGGVCTICWCLCDAKNRICADHCHATGLTRSAICRKCNVLVGLIEKNKTKQHFPAHEAYIQHYRALFAAQGVL